MKDLLHSSLLPEVLQISQRIAQFQTEWRLSVDVGKDFYIALQKTTIITSAGASTRIEGAKLSDEEILQRFSGLKIKSIHDRDEAEVAGYIDCKKYIFDHHADLDISEHTIRSLHQMMMRYLSESIFPLEQRGAYKNVPNSVVRIDHAAGTQEVIFETTPAGPQTEAAMQELVLDYKNFIQDPNYSDLEVIAAFIVKFLAVHPFRDGNGRISRLLTDLCLLKKGYNFCMYSSHEKVIEDNKAQYYVALRQTQATLKSRSDINPWFLYFLKIISLQTQFLKNKMQGRKPGTLTDLEQKVYELVSQYQPVTIGFLERQSQIKRVTLKSILARLKENEVLVMEGEKKTSHYRLK